MAGPDAYRFVAGGRRSSAASLTVLEGGRDLIEAPIRESSPESDDAPAVGGMVSRGDNWIPGAYLSSLVATNDDPMLQRMGGDLRGYDALLSDETAFSTLQQRRLAITSRDWEVTPGDENDPRSVKAADDFRAMIDALGFDRVTGFLHYAVWYGYAVAEGIYSVRQHDGRTIVWLDDIVVPDRRHFGFTGQGQLRYVGEGAVFGGGVVPDNKFVALRTGGTHDFAFYGIGLAHWCYWPIFFKRNAMKFWALYLEKFGAPTVGIEFDETDANDKTKKAKLLQTAAAVTRDSAITVPKGYLTEDRIKVLEATRQGSGASSFMDFVGEQNEAVMRVVLGQPGTSKGVSSGLNSDQASEHADVKAEIVKADSDLITDALQRTFGRWITRWNHGEDVAPPNLRRILDDGEDLSTTAKRDVDLNGIGIRRTEDSVKATYGEGYEVDRETVEERNAREAAQAAAKAGVVVPSGDAAARDRIAEFAAQGGSSNAPLYVSRKLLNPGPLIAWAKAQGFGDLTPADEMHVTILYSKTAVDWFAMAGEGWDWREVKVEEGGPRFVEQFGDAIVLRFADAGMGYRHNSMIERGASSDFPDYKPHVTISYGGAGGVDLSKVEPFTGELRFGPEIFEPIKSDEGDSGTQFSARQEAAIDRLADAMTREGHPVFAAMATHLRGALEGVETAEEARVAILQAAEALPIDRLARLTALPLLAERAGAMVGADDLIDASRSDTFSAHRRREDHDEGAVKRHALGGQPRFVESEHPRADDGTFRDKPVDAGDPSYRAVRDKADEAKRVMADAGVKNVEVSHSINRDNQSSAYLTGHITATAPDGREFSVAVGVRVSDHAVSSNRVERDRERIQYYVEANGKPDFAAIKADIGRRQSALDDHAATAAPREDVGAAKREARASQATQEARAAERTARREAHFRQTGVDRDKMSKGDYEKAVKAYNRENPL